MTSSNQYALAWHHKNCYLIVTLFFIGFLSNSSAQTSFEMLLGYSPGQSINTQEIPIHIGYGVGRFAISPIRQSAGYTVGLGVQHSMRSGFFMRAELQYNYSNVQYGLRDISFPNEAYSPMDLNETRHVLALPLSIGVELGIVRITSGVNANTVLRSITSLTNLEGMKDNSPLFYMGWHSGVGLDFKRFGIEMRYNQDFRNYGQGYSIGDRELTFYGNPVRWTFVIKYLIGI